MSESDVAIIYQILIGLGGMIVLLALMAVLWRWIFKVDRHIKNQELILHVLVQLYKKHGATDEELQKLHEHFNSK